MSWTHKSSPRSNRAYRGRHRFEHWYRDNQVYFITARVRNRLTAFAGESAKAHFWDRFEHYTNEFSFVPWVTTLLDNHYHTLGYLRIGKNLGIMMQRLHGSVAKLVNDTLDDPHRPFWAEAKDKGYFDGCIRDVKQCRLAYRYTLTQAVRHGIVTDARMYPHTHVNVELDEGVKRALELGAFLEGVPYRRYDDRP